MSSAGWRPGGRAGDRLATGRSWIGALGLVVGLALQTACGAGGDAPVDEARAVAGDARASRVVVAVAHTGESRLGISVPGEVMGARDAMLSSALGGYVEAVAVHPGEVVQQGALIARVDSEIHGASYEMAAARVTLAESELDRVVRMGDLAAPAQKERAETEVAIARAQRAQSAAQSRRATVRAPFSGVIGDTFVEVGEVAGPGTPIARLVQLDPVVVSLSVPDRDVVSLREGMRASVTATARAGSIEGTVHRIAATADSKTRAFLVEVMVPNADHSLLPGMIARVDIEGGGGGQAMIVPQDWVVTRLDGAGVFLDDGGVARWRPVVLGDVLRDRVVVTSGLNEGDRVVVVGHRELVDGDPLVVARVEGGA